MKTYQAVLLAGLFLCCPCAGQVPEKPADLPDRYRDLAIVTTSEPDVHDPTRIVMSIRLNNRGRRPLSTRISLLPHRRFDLSEGQFKSTVLPGSQEIWRVSVRTPDDLVKTVLRGKLFFGSTHARNLFIAVRGRDPENWKPNRDPDVDDPAETLAITDRAQVVATYSPRVRIDWWQAHPSSSVMAEQRAKPLITLGAAGRTAHAILLQLPDAARANSGFQQALSDLVRGIRIISDGAELKRVEQRVAGHPVIALRIDPGQDWAHPDMYHLFTEDNGDVTIAAGDIDGVRNGIYGLLTDHLDCHWFMPGGLGEEIPTPTDKRAVIGQIDQRRTPSFFSARGSTWGQETWNLRNRNIANDGQLSIGHAWAGLLKGTSELYEKHPDWWARERDGNIRKFDVKGAWSSTNFCTTNPEVLDIVSRKLNEHLSHPDAILASVDPNDYAPFCLCDTCLAVDESYGANNPDGAYSTDRMIHFANEMHRRLPPESQHKMLGFLVYGYQIQLPAGAKPDPGVIGMICNMDWSYDHTRPMSDPTSPSNRKFLRLVRGWAKRFKHFGFYDYPTDYLHYAPYGQVMKLREDIPLVRDLGVTFIVIEGQPILATSALNLYICSRLQYDVNADVDVLMEEFFHKFHGPAVEPMRNYWLGAEYYTATLRPGPRAQDRVTRIAEMWEQLDGHLKQAEFLVADLPDTEKRFRDRVAYQRRGFELARRKCAIRDSVDAPDKEVRAEAFAADTRRCIEAYQDWIAETQQAHAADSEYWPPLIPGYYYVELDQFLKRTLDEINNANGAAAGL